MRYRFRDLSFDVPDGLVDQSMIVLVDEESLAITVAREAKGGALKQYVDEALKELSANVSGYNLDKRDDKTVAGKPAVLLTQTAMTPEGQPVAQRQAYVDMGADVVVVTCTAPKKDAAKATAAFDKLLTTMALG